MKKLLLLIGLVVFVNGCSYSEPTRISPPVKFNEKGFVLRQDQKSLTYLNSDDDIPGRFLYDQKDVSDDYQVHVIYLLAKDSEDYKSDVKGIIEKKYYQEMKNSNKKQKITSSLDLI